MTRNSFLSALLLSTALLLPGMPALAQGGACLSDIDIQNAVANGQILPLNEVIARAGMGGAKVLPPVRVCDQGGQLFYLVSVLNGGEAQTLALNAVTGQP